MKGAIKRRAALGDTAIAFEIRECTGYNTTVSGSVFASSGTRRLGNLCLFHPKMLLTISYKDCHHCFFRPNHAEVRAGARTHRSLLWREAFEKPLSQNLWTFQINRKINNQLQKNNRKNWKIAVTRFALSSNTHWHRTQSSQAFHRLVNYFTTSLLWIGHRRRVSFRVTITRPISINVARQCRPQTRNSRSTQFLGRVQEANRFSQSFASFQLQMEEHLNLEDYLILPSGEKRKGEKKSHVSGGEREWSRRAVHRRRYLNRYFWGRSLPKGGVANNFFGATKRERDISQISAHNT